MITVALAFVIRLGKCAPVVANIIATSHIAFSA
jgi:hypothetical protein